MEKYETRLLSHWGQNLFICPKSHAGNQTLAVRLGTRGGQTGLCAHLGGGKRGSVLNV